MNEIIVTSEDLFNLTKAAQQLKITRMTLYRWLKAGKILSIKLGGASYVPKSEVERLLRADGDGIEVPVKRADKSQEG